MSIRRLSVFAVVALALSPLAADAQVINRPQRAFRGLFGGGRQTDPTQFRQELTFTLNGLGGYDDNVLAGEGPGTAPPPGSTDTAGSTFNVDAALDYFVGRAARSFRASFGAGATGYGDVPLGNSQFYRLDLSATTDFGRRTTLSVSEGLRYSSQYRLDGALTSTLPVEDLPTLDSSIYGLGDRSTIDSTTSVSLEQRLSRTNSLQGTYGYTATTFTEGDENGYKVHQASGRYHHQISRWWEAHGLYEYSTTQYAFSQGDAGRRMRQNRITGGGQYQRRLSPRRSMRFDFEGGAFSVASVTGVTFEPFTVWAPFVSVATELDLGRQWNLGGNFRRGADTLEGLSTEAFLNDAGTVTLSGLVSRRVDLSFIAGLARGTQAAGEGNSRYLTGTGSAQVRIALTRMLATVVSYHYYRYKFEDTVLLDPTLPPLFERNAVRVGLSLFLPLYGNASGR